MKPENARMRQFLADNGIDGMPKWIDNGSLRRCWRIYCKGLKWSQKAADQMNALGFTDFDGRPLTAVSGNGGMWQIFVRGHEDLANPGDQRCTLTDAQPMLEIPSYASLPPVNICVLRYTQALTHEWTRFADLKAKGFENFCWFDELVGRGMIEGMMAPYEFQGGRAMGSQYWFRLKN